MVLNILQYQKKQSLEGITIKKLQTLLESTEFHYILFIICFLLLSFPFASIVFLKEPGNTFAYLFISWGIVIVILLLTSKHYKQQSSTSESKKQMKGSR